MAVCEQADSGAASERTPDGSPPDPAALIARLAEAIGPDRISDDPDLRTRHATDWSGVPAAAPLAVVRPRTTEEVSAVLQICSAAGQPVAVQGGRTGLCGGAATGDGEIALSLDRMTGLSTVDRRAGTLTVEAGVTLAAVQEAAEESGLFYAVDIGARGTAQIGGTIATNAGGIRVLRYGMTREQVLGLEVVLADGTVLSDMSGMQKNNTGIDLKQLFIGSEGSLGIVTRAVLRLHPRPGATATAWVTMDDETLLPDLLASARAALGPALGAFEPMWRDYLETVSTRMSGFSLPLDPAPVAVIVECFGPDEAAAREALEGFLADRMEAGRVTDAVIASSVDQERRIWAVRDEVPAAYPTAFKAIIPFDVSIPIGRMNAAVGEMRSELTTALPDADLLFYGHLGDSNLHVVVGLHEALTTEAKHRAEAIVYDRVRALGGSVSAEHGIGRSKRRWLAHTRSAAEIETMRRLKAALDPAGILNPGRSFAA
ncbi:FAD-binding oxidoreductase [Amorphus orientalis]|uniref:FAD/FMN-containing dehydrogenase n=1 Tax=Amorphus orientalis TaxID=649198 RepID=A0AAE4ARI2_9HYPH|nr:FAD-binding oxidoreductase [Amorphus orientalis]MDQ0313860.1 FAD/FMN-containing dehydrogenase [Amorphus orientalis]